MWTLLCSLPRKMRIQNLKFIIIKAGFQHFKFKQFHFSLIEFLLQWCSFKRVVTFFLCVDTEQGRSSTRLPVAQQRDSEVWTYWTERRRGTTLVTYKSCIEQVSYVTSDYFRSHMIDVTTEITRIKKYFIIINIVELDLNTILLTI